MIDAHDGAGSERDAHDGAGSERPSAGRLLAVIAVCLGLVAFAVGPASAAGTTVTLQAAEDQTETGTVQFSFTPQSGGTVSADDFTSTAGGDVSFSFQRWEGGGSSGSSNQWTVEAGTRYTVTYEVAVQSNVDEGTYSSTVEITSGGSTVASERLDVTVDVKEPRFGAAPAPNELGEVNVVREEPEEVSFTVPIENTGDGLMKIDSVELQNLPAGFSDGTGDPSLEIAANSQGQLTVAVDVGPDVEPGFYDFTVRVEDTLGNTQSFTVDLEIDEVYPEFGRVSEQTTTVTFDEPSDGTQTVTVSPDVPNTGEGAMRLSGPVEFSNLPDGVEPVQTSVPDSLIPANGEVSVPFSLEVADSVEAGSYEFSVTVTDSLGNTEEFPVTLRVRRPPIVGVGDGGGETVDLGGVVVGETTDVGVNVSELGGANGIDGLSTTVIRSADNGELDVSSVENLQVPAGETRDTQITVSVSEDAAQHETLEWSVLLGPNTNDAKTRRFTLQARVLYPPKLANVSTSPTTLTFDRQRPTSDYQTTKTVTFDNSGDLDMEVTDVAATVRGASGVTATVTDAPTTVEGLSTGSASVQVTADPETAEGSYTLEVTVETAEGGTQTITREVTVTHDVELSLEQTDVSFGEVNLRTDRTRTIDIAEVLGYQDVSNLQIERVSGPETFLSISERPPETLEAGESSRVIFLLRFDTAAEIGRQYEWTFRVSGDGVEERTITLRATPRTRDFGELESALDSLADADGSRGELGAGGVEMLTTLEERLLGEESIEDGTLPTTLSTARSILLFGDAADEAAAAQSAGNYTAAQRQLLRAATVRNLLQESTANLPSYLQEPASRSVRAANETLGPLVTAQRDHYEEVLAGEPPADERARAHRALAQLATITGDSEAAARHRQAASESRQEYLSLVENASRDRARADAEWRSLRENATFVIAGQPLVANPARLNAVFDRLDRIDGLYGGAITAYTQAGADDEAGAVRTRRSGVAGQASILRFGLYGSIALYGLAVVSLVVFVTRRGISYARDAQEAALGDDFLLQS